MLNTIEDSFHTDTSYLSRTQPILEQVAKLKPIPLSQLSQEELSRFQSIPLYMQVLKHNTENGKKAQANKNAKQVKTLGTDVAKEKKKKSQIKSLREEQAFIAQKFQENIAVIEVAEGMKMYQCKLCQAEIAFKRKAKNHAVLCQSRKNAIMKIQKLVNCTAETCELSFKTKKDMYQHFNSSHSELLPSFSCSVCAKVIRNMSNFRKHIKLHRSLLNRNCPYCEKQIKGYNLTRHIKRKHGSNMKGSAIIEDTVSNIVEANWDEQISPEQELMRDESCDDYAEMHRPGENEMITGTDNQTLVTDTAMSIDDNHYCNLEGDKMTDEGIQLIPLQSIANRTQFICDECNYRAGSRYNLTRHKESLHTVKVGSCPHLFCNEKFPSKFTMKVHFANCFLYCNWDNCDKKYKNKKLFDKHQAGHADKLRRMI